MPKSIKSWSWKIILTKIKLALAEPNPFVMDELRRAFPSGKRVEFCLADRLEIDYCLRRNLTSPNWLFLTQ